ncbi:hypothetical protein FLACHUCJ7_03286 [Flavobacterium chungangense]|uniref:Uncharacterized protein n=1 Tax=Flavobacterium chungangense TaxID=554283 RepID=A0A6V6Z704_9FLAO|nr:hypothetical protein FLACHUCJ7_03286 [Flavobacterium chungangense]
MSLLGGKPNCFLKHLLKYNGSLKPTILVTSETLYFFVFSNSADFFKRMVLINSLGAKSVNSLIFLYSLEELTPNLSHKNSVDKSSSLRLLLIKLVIFSINSSSIGECVSRLTLLSTSPENFTLSSNLDLIIFSITVFNNSGSNGFTK